MGDSGKGGNGDVGQEWSLQERASPGNTEYMKESSLSLCDMEDHVSGCAKGRRGLELGRTDLGKVARGQASKGGTPGTSVSFINLGTAASDMSNMDNSTETECPWNQYTGTFLVLSNVSYNCSQTKELSSPSAIIGGNV